MTYKPICPHCEGAGLVWVTSDKNGWAIDADKPFSTRRLPEPQLSPCVCHGGCMRYRSENPGKGTGFVWRKRNALYGVPELLSDGSSGIYVMLKRIETNWTATPRLNWYAGTGEQPSDPIWETRNEC